MTALPPNNTDRVWVHYTGPAGAHEVMFRYSSLEEVEAQVLSARGVVVAMAALMPTSVTFDGARWSAKDTLVSNPVDFTPVVGSNSGTLTGEMYPNFVDWIGRDLSGRRVRWSINGTLYPADTNYRVEEGENATIDGVLSALRAASPAIKTISGGVPTIYHYADTGRNAYFQRKRRRTA